MTTLEDKTWAKYFATAKIITIDPGKSTDVKFYTDKLELYSKYAVWIQTAYKNDMNNDKTSIYSPIEAVPGINVFKKDRSVESFASKENFTV